VPHERPIWIHAASIGELVAATPLVELWRSEGRALHGSATSPSGRALWRSRWPDVPSGLAPLDHPWCVDRALDRVRPIALVLVETELWPFWIAAARRRGIPVIVVSGRLSERSLRRYRRLGPLWRPTLARLSGVGAASARDAERFAALGVPRERIRVTGDLKLEIPGRPATPPADLVKALGGGPVWVAGSTHPGEERAVAHALARVEAAGFRLRTVVAPRRLERLDAVERELRGGGRAVRRRSRLGPAGLADGEILLVDGLGELGAIYAAADFAFVGGSLADVGGHNLVEPLLAGCLVVHGPHVERSEPLLEALRGTGACCRVADATALGDALLGWLRDPEAGRRAVRLGRAALERLGGNATRTADFVLAAGGGGTARAASPARAARSAHS